MVLVARAFGLTPESKVPAPAVAEPAATSGTPAEEITVSWFDKLFGAAPAPKADADEVLSREFDDRLTEAENAVEGAMTALAALRSAKRAGQVA